MDSLITAAARALAAGDLLGALKRVALRDDAPALALRGIAMAQLGDLVRAKALLRARRAPSVRKRWWPARDVSSPRPRSRSSHATWGGREGARRGGATLEAHGDRVNAAHARTLEVRRLLLIGRLDEAEHALAALDPAPFPPASRADQEEGLRAGGRGGPRERALVRHDEWPQADRDADEGQQEQADRAQERRQFEAMAQRVPFPHCDERPSQSAPARETRYRAS